MLAGVLLCSSTQFREGAGTVVRGPFSPICGGFRGF